MKITQGTKVKLHFALQLADGTDVDSTYDKSPAEFVVGDGKLPEPIEALLCGLEVGASVDHEMSADLVFGSVLEEHQVWLPITDFPTSMVLEKGLVVSFGGANTKGDSVGVVDAITEDQILIDFNHPLAGRMIRFKADILQIGFAN